MMIWHIFKKDLKLLWPLVMAVAAVQFLNAAIWLILRNTGGSQILAPMSELCSIAAFIVMGVLVAIAVQQDAVPGDRQDWLVRPIRRRDLLLAKLLFILIAVHGPLLLSDSTLGMATGFSFGASLSAGLSHGVSLLVTLSLPVLAVAAMTPTLVVFFGGFLTVGLVGFLAIILVANWNQYHAGIVPISGIWWMIPALWSALALLAVGVAVPLQYFRRATMHSRGIVIGAVLLAPMIVLLPWTSAFSLQQRLSADPVTAKAIFVAFDPNFGKLVLGPGGRNHANSMWLPLRVSGLAPDSILFNDRTSVRIIGRDGATLFRGQTMSPGSTADLLDNFPVRTMAGGEVRTHQIVTLPGRIYDLVRSQPVRMELDYSLTLFRIEGFDTIAALHGDKQMSNIGLCKTGIDGDGDEVETRCVKTGGGPSCASVVLENTVSGKRNPQFNICVPDYSPYMKPFKRYPVNEFGLNLSFRDPQGLAKYPVDSSQLANARVSLKIYQPVAHFTRHLVIPEIRLGDWEAEAAKP